MAIFVYAAFRLLKTQAPLFRLLNNALQLPGLIRRGSWNFLAAATTTHAAAVWAHSLPSLLHHILLLSSLLHLLMLLHLLLLAQTFLFFRHGAGLFALL